MTVSGYLDVLCDFGHFGHFLRNFLVYSGVLVISGVLRGLLFLELVLILRAACLVGFWCLVLFVYFCVGYWLV